MPELTSKPSTSSGISLRSVLAGTVLVVLNALWVTCVEVRYYMLDGASLPFFITPIFLNYFITYEAGAAGRRRTHNSLVGFRLGNDRVRPISGTSSAGCRSCSIRRAVRWGFRTR